MIRLTFVGDIALDKPLLKAARTQKNGEFDFSDVFHTEEVFQNSDLVVGNLETVFGGGKRYNKKPYHYNSPDSFCKAIRDAGIGLVSTANNHCMDEGVKGLQRTTRVLDEFGIIHTGTFSKNTTDRFLVREIKGLKISFYSLTYSVNAGMESVSCGSLYDHVNLLGFSGKRLPLPKRLFRYVIKPKIKQIKRKAKNQSTISARQDVLRQGQINSEWMAEVERQIERAKTESDLLVVLLHIGGQFNTEPGGYSKFMMDRLCDFGADAIIGNHPHTVQRVENREGKIVAYSLGGFCMSVSGEYLVRDCLPEYSLALHVEIDENNKEMHYFSDIIKGTEDERAYLIISSAPDGDSGAEVIRERSKTVSKN